MHKLTSLLLIALLTLGLASCGVENASPRVQQFIDDQREATTPHGEIVAESVIETDTGVQYTTTDGSHLEVDMPQNEDGRYTYGEPRHLEDASN